MRKDDKNTQERIKEEEEKHKNMREIPRFITLQLQSQFNFHEDIPQDLAINQFQTDAIFKRISRERCSKKNV